MEDEIKKSKPSKDDKLWGMLAHLSALIFSFLGPLVIYLLKKDDSKFIKECALESLNFQITVIVFLVVYGVLSTILSFIFIGVVMMMLIPFIGLFLIVLMIFATVKTYGGELYRYPFNIKFIK
jgi:hypothetical protein